MCVSKDKMQPGAATHIIGSRASGKATLALECARRSGTRYLVVFSGRPKKWASLVPDQCVRDFAELPSILRAQELRVKESNDRSLTIILDQLSREQMASRDITHDVAFNHRFYRINLIVITQLLRQLPSVCRSQMDNILMLEGSDKADLDIAFCEYVGAEYCSICEFVESYNYSTYHRYRALIIDNTARLGARRLFEGRVERGQPFPFLAPDTLPARL